MSLDQFTLLIDNQVFSVAEYEVNYDMFLGAGNFAAVIDYTKKIDLSRNNVSFEIRINDIPVMKGFVDKTTREYSKGVLKQNISGRDMMQVLIDNYVIEPHPYPGKAVKQSAIDRLFSEDTEEETTLPVDRIITDVWNTSKQISNGYIVLSNGGLRRIALPEVNFPVYATNANNLSLFQIKSISTSHGQTMFQFFSNLLNGLGLYMYNVPGTTDIIIHSIQSEQPVVNYNKRCEHTNNPYQIINQPGNSGNNVISASFTQDISEYYSYLKFIGQTSTDSFFKDRGVRYYSGLIKLKSTVLNVIDNNVWEHQHQRLINNEVMAQNKSLYNLSYTVSGHVPAGSTEPYFFNHTTVVTDEYMSISNQTFLVNSVTYKGSKQDGQTTELQLYSPSFVPGIITNPDVPRSEF